jgi:hypothetical protein
MIWSMITGLLPDVWPYIAGTLALIGGWFVAKRQGAQGAKAKQAEAQAKAERKAHERINEADLGIGASDADRIERLRGFAAKHGTRQTKGPGGDLR